MKKKGLIMLSLIAILLLTSTASGCFLFGGGVPNPVLATSHQTGTYTMTSPTPKSWTLPA